MKFVLDNSVAMRWGQPSSNATDQVYAMKVLIALKTERCVVPSLFWFEAAAVAAKQLELGSMSRADIHVLFGLLRRLSIDVSDMEPVRLAERCLQLSMSLPVSGYDAAYLALCEEYALPLASLDRDLLKAAKRLGVPRLTF